MESISRLYKILSISLFMIFSPHSSQIRLIEKTDVARVWAGHPVDFAIKTQNGFQCVAYYDTARRMCVALRTVGSSKWTYKVLPTTTGWDSHNYIEMAFDDSGYIHISGNMHNASSLIYFRSRKPYDIESFSSPGMIGSREGSISYPVFIKGPDNQLIFQYRDGGSGSGTTIWNSYDVTSKKWTRITGGGLLDGEGEVNAYQTTPVCGPDGFFHIIWMWRDSPIANTNHHLSHMKSKNLSEWRTMAGAAIALPVRRSTPGVVVDPVESGHGLINMDFWISWDRRNRAVVTYHRYDDRNVSQIFNTRYEDGAWKIRQTSDWSGFKWDLEREGSLSHDIAATPLEIDESGELVQNYLYRNGQLRRWVLDEETLKPTSDDVYRPPEAMEELYRVESTFPGMQVNRKRDGEYYIKWETMPVNQDKERAAGTYPSSSVLRVYRFAADAAAAGRISGRVDGFTDNKLPRRVVIGLKRYDNTLYCRSILQTAIFTFDGRLAAAGRSAENIQERIALPCGVYIIGIKRRSAVVTDEKTPAIYRREELR